VAADGISVVGVAVTWPAVSNATYYQVYRNGTVVRSTVIGTTYNDASATALVVYTYQVKACNPSGCSDLSPSDTGFRAIGPPASVTASDGTYFDRVAVSWPAASGATSYEVYRDGTLLSAVSGTSYNDTAAVAGTIYGYQIKACNATSCSDLSVANTGYRAVVAPDEVFPPGGSLPAGWASTPNATAGWSAAGDSAYEGVVSLKSDDVNGNQTAAVQVTKKFRDGDITFARKVSSESGYDYLTFYVDGVMKDRWSGEVGWAVVSYTLSAGIHTLKWQYSKDSIISSGSDAAWIDAVTLPIATPGGDVDGDGKADVVWHHGATGDNAIWLMDGASVKASPLITAVPDLGWAIAGSGDFDGDGRSDLVWRHSPTGVNAVWLMEGATVKAGPLITAVPDLGWQIVAVADYDGDGKADLAWRHTLTGDNAIWLMDGATVKAGPLITAVPDLGWAIVGTGDFDGDGKADLLWRHSPSGLNAIWLMDGATVRAGPLINAVPDLGWAIAGTGDFDGDGKADLVWRHSPTGLNAIWLMDGATVKTGPLITAVPDPDWHIVAVADYDGDGKADLAWRHASLGANAIWLMDGATVKSAPLIPAVPDAGWAIVR
jgi:hypothetical protein